MSCGQREARIDRIILEITLIPLACDELDGLRSYTYSTMITSFGVKCAGKPNEGHKGSRFRCPYRSINASRVTSQWQSTDRQRALAFAGVRYRLFDG